MGLQKSCRQARMPDHLPNVGQPHNLGGMPLCLARYLHARPLSALARVWRGHIEVCSTRSTPRRAHSAVRKYFLVSAVSAIWATSQTAAAPVGDDPVGNWFHDPFFQVRSAIHDCPTPAGPVLPRSRIQLEEHSRAERGTSCWLAGKCAQSNAYQGDQAIGKAVKDRFAADSRFADTSLWITVKRKFVWVEGCIDNPHAGNELRDFVSATPGVEMVFVDVRKTAAGRIPYAIQPESPTRP